ncbi:MAG TPA: hypothetical protein VFR35_20615 [Actinoplanes sp.]|nr:hypothetical protein [Actinoplanes sp.]
MIKWHIERYDRLRTSTASRASVVLSAGALLSAGNVLLITQILARSADWLRSWWLLLFTLIAVTGVGLVMASLLRAAGVLVTLRSSRAEFASAGELPVSLIYNGTDTLAHLPTFEAFRSAVRGQDPDDAAAAAEVELWVCINQHRSRYARLRQAVRLLRHAALAYVAAMLLALVVNMTYGL